ncbi:MAG: FAD-dependent oxidoreductase [Aminivibrio sp.]|jgi:NADPH-dependent 2,4-dienoyl-CoA reductase/sulfur reductase-like enzyme|nr:FAD-dependent oxidoreductase [Synergistaceae bacterium]
MAKERIVIIGADAAGMSAAGQARKLLPGAEITAYERSPHCSYAACGIPYYTAGLVESETRLIARTPGQFLERQNIVVRTRCEVLSVNTDEGSMTVRDLESGKEFSDRFDKLLFATGAVPAIPPVEGSDAKGVFSLSTLESGIAVRKFADEERPKRVTVIGGGYIGLEMAEAFSCIRGLEVTLLDKSPQVMNTFDPDMAEFMAQAIREAGTELRLGEGLVAFGVKDGRVRTVITEKGEIETDMVVMGLGVRPNTALAREAGLELSVRDSIRVDGSMATSRPNVWAAGDCASTTHLITGKPFWIALGTVANKTGRVAGISMGGGGASFGGVVGTAMSKHCAFETARTGLTEKEAAEHGFKYVSTVIKTKTRAGYYPGAEVMHVKLVAEKGTGRLLGGQIVGGQGAAKRVDILATALTAKMTLQELIDLDLGYAPPFSPVWDPVQIAGRSLLGKMGGE